MFAVVSYNGKQYKVEVGKEYKIDLIGEQEKKGITFANVLVVDDDETVKVGKPYVENITVEGEIIKDIKDDKVTGVKFHAKKRYKRNLGHRQQYTVVKIKQINS